MLVFFGIIGLLSLVMWLPQGLFGAAVACWGRRLHTDETGFPMGGSL